MKINKNSADRLIAIGFGILGIIFAALGICQVFGGTALGAIETGCGAGFFLGGLIAFNAQKARPIVKKF